MQVKDEAYREKRRLYAIEYRKQNALKIKERHEWRLENDEDYARRYREKCERRNQAYAVAHAEETERRKQHGIDLAIARKERERVRSKKYRDARNSLRKSEIAAQAREYRKANGDRINELRREKRKNDPVYAAKVRERDRARTKTNLDRRMNTAMKKYYGITIADYDAMYLSQSGKCNICGDEHPSRGRNRLVVDHCHTEGHVRGLLCTPCNTAIGQMKDSVERLSRAIEYLRR